MECPSAGLTAKIVYAIWFPAD